MSSLSCPSAAVCNATDPNGILRTADSGKKWVNQVLPTGVTSVGYLSCPSASTCMAGGSLGQGAVTVHTTDAGARWAAVDLPTGISQLDAVACRAASVCEAGGTISAGYGIERTTNGGTAWVNQTLMYTPTTPFGSGQLSSIVCSKESVCVAATTGSYIFRTNDGGTRWADDKTVPSGFAPKAVACPSTSVCDAVGGGISRTTDGGATWVSSTVPSASTADLVDIACPSVKVCEAVGYNDSTSGGALALRTTDGGARWFGQKVPSNMAELSAVACPSTSTCEVIGASFAISSGYTVLDCWGSPQCEMASSGSQPSYPYSLRTTDGGTRWVSKKLPANVGTLNSIACPSTSVCEAVGASAAAARATPSPASGSFRAS